VALWRAVKCGSCGALITKSESIVTRDSFRQALVRARQSVGDIQCAGHQYRLLELLGTGEMSQVYLAQRVGAVPYLATIKLSSSPPAVTRYAREAEVLRELHALSPLLPEVIAQATLDGDSSRQALVLAHPNGYWGSLADLNARFPEGLDPRHAVWIWRRMLDALHFVHAHGWSHGDVRPEHALVHAGDHAVRLISWGGAAKDARHQALDLVRCARTVMVLVSGASGADTLPGRVPVPLANLVTRASRDETFCRTQGAQGLDDLLRAAAQEAFGPPSFVPLNI
jgi:serine/threonine protein kinase